MVTPVMGCFAQKPHINLRNVIYIDRNTKNKLAMFVYKDYAGQVEFDVEAEILFGRVLDINDVVTFQGKTVAEPRQ